MVQRGAQASHFPKIWGWGQNYDLNFLKYSDTSLQVNKHLVYFWVVYEIYCDPTVKVFLEYPLNWIDFEATISFHIDMLLQYYFTNIAYADILGFFSILRIWLPHICPTCAPNSPNSDFLFYVQLVLQILQILKFLI